jgi:hypothetical protein
MGKGIAPVVINGGLKAVHIPSMLTFWNILMHWTHLIDSAIKIL